jgi:hypothetical protein
MKIRGVKVNRRRKALEIAVARRRLTFPFARLKPSPTAKDPLVTAIVDRELGSEGITYVLKSGQEGTVHVEDVL